MDILSQAVINGLILGGFYALMTQGLTLIFGVMRVINLAHGEFLMLGAYLGWFINNEFGLDPFMAAPLIGALGFIIGGLVSWVFLMPVVERPPLMALLITFGFAAVIASGLSLYFTNTPRFTETGYGDTVLTFLGQRIPLARALMFVFAVCVLLLLWLFLQRTRTGKAIRAASQNKDAAKIVGIEISRIYCTTFGIGTALVFVAGGLYGATQGFFPFMGPVFTLKAFAVVVLGGLGRTGGTFLAAMILALIETFVATYVPGIGTGLGLAAAFILVVVVLAVRPQGIFGSAELEEA